MLVLAVLMVSYASSMRAYIEQRHHLASLESDIAESKATIEELRREKERWDDPAYVRTQARQRFGWVLPGEVAYQVIDEDGTPLDHDDSLTDPDVIAAEQQPLWWQSAWESVEVAGHPEDADMPPPATSIKAPKPANKSDDKKR